MENRQGGKRRLGHGLAAMQAILGLPRWAALGQAAEAGWTDEVQPLWDSYARRVLRPATLLRTLDEVAAGSPRMANQWLKAWLTDRRVPGSLWLDRHVWVSELPEGLEVAETLMVHRSDLRLPAGLRVGGELWLDTSSLHALPAGLVVAGSLWIRHCGSWDGLIPADARVKGRVFSDPHPNGLPLDEWRARYPLGERPDLSGAR